MEAECLTHKCHSSGSYRTLAWEKGLAKEEGVYSGLSGQQRPWLGGGRTKDGSETHQLQGSLGLP